MDFTRRGRFTIIALIIAVLSCSRGQTISQTQLVQATVPAEVQLTQEPLSLPVEKTVERNVPRKQFFAITSIEKNEYFTALAGLNVGWVSSQPVIVWHDIEKIPGVYTWETLDETVLNLQKVGLDPTAVLMPVQATEEQMKLIKEKTRSEKLLDFLRLKEAAEMQLYPHTPEEMKAWRLFLRAVVSRYDGDGNNDAPELRFPIRSWRVVDEYPVVWMPDTQGYVSLLKASYQEIKILQPDADVIPFGLESHLAQQFAFSEGMIVDDTAGVVNGTKLSRAQIAANKQLQERKKEYEYILKESKGFYDGVDIHLYEPRVTYIAGKVAWVRSVLERIGSRVPVWCLEGGGPFKLKGGQRSEYGDLYYGKYSDKENAEFVAKMYTIAAASGVERLAWVFGEHESGSFLGGPWLNMGLIHPNGSQKPSYYTFRIVNDFLSGYTDVTDLSSGEISLYEFSVAGALRYIAWREKESRQNTTNLIKLMPASMVSVTPVVTELDALGKPVLPDVLVVEASAVPLTTTPVLIVGQ